MFLGALGGLLYAPATGNRTRALLKDKYTKYSHEIPEFVDRHGRDLSNRMEGVKHDLSLMKDDMRGRYDEVSMRMREQAGPLKERMVEMRDDMKMRLSDARGRVEEKVGEIKEQINERRDGQDRQSA
jgi:gas vesicle protein